ncbi:hypothetical protein ACF0H5_008500 [Mactra antiquata]
MSDYKSSKGRSSKHSSDREEDEYSKKRSKKSKKKDKHKDKTKDKDREKSKDKKKDKKGNEPEMTAIEKFNLFKKQRESAKADDTVVDDLFKDFIASKLKQIENDKEKTSEKKGTMESDNKAASSVHEMNKFLDDEINNIALPPDMPKSVPEIPKKLPIEKNFTSEKKLPPEKNLTLERKLPSSQPEAVSKAKLNVMDNPTKLGSLLKSKISEKLNSDKSKPDLFHENKILTSLDKTSESKISNKECRINLASKVEVDKATEKDLPVFGPHLPKSMVNDVNDEEAKVEIKKPATGFKNFGIKLSVTSAELIQSGEIHKKGKRLEDGEVLSSSSDGSDSSDSEPCVNDDDDDNDDEVSGTGSLSDSDGDVKKSKKKKKKKDKHKKKKKKHKKEKDKSDLSENGKDKLSSKRKGSVARRSRSRSPKRSRRSRTRSRSRDRSRRSSRSRSRDRKYRRSRSRSRGRRSFSRGRRSRSRDRRSRSRGRRSRSRSPDRFWTSKYGDFDAYKFLKGKRDRGRSRSKSPDRERDRFIEKEKKRMEDLRLKIDKTKLREIAIKNAVTNARSGGGPQLDVTIKAGGKSVEELTEYCKKIQEKEIEKKKLKNHYESSSDEEPTKHSDDEDMLHHPFQVKEPGAIIVDIKNAKQLPVATPQERIAQTAQLRLQFPVSSGSQHRDKEWVPVEPEPTPKVTPKSNTVAGVPALMPPPPAPPKPKPEVKVFEEPPTAPVDITSIVSERLTAMKKLQENPNDVSAKIILSKAQKQASQWAQSKNLPGQFIGSTGASIMTQEELMGDRKRQAWLKKDVFTNAAPVSGGIGMFLLQKMGWKHGEGLGKNNEGSKEPLMLDFKVDRKGLVTDGEGKKGSQPKVPVVKDLSGKHPVSALGELCNKRRWGAPHYELVHESGPPHKKDFLFKVRVNGTDYQPSITSNNKKLAKAQSATVCLQELGLVPRTALQ